MWNLCYSPSCWHPATLFQGRWVAFRLWSRCNWINSKLRTIKKEVNHEYAYSMNIPWVRDVIKSRNLKKYQTLIIHRFNFADTNYFIHENFREEIPFNKTVERSIFNGSNFSVPVGCMSWLCSPGSLQSCHHQLSAEEKLFRLRQHRRGG